MSIEPEALPSRSEPFRPDNLPYRSIGRLFIGRDDFLPRLRASLQRAAGGATAIVHGLGGIGKTRAALEYALRHADEYTALLFLRASDPAALDTQIAALAGVLRLPEEVSPDDIVKREAVLAWLASHPGWLLILDNADTPDCVRAADALARRLRLGHVILTSRLTEFPLGIESLGLDLLTLDDATEYLLTATEGARRAEPDDAARARELAEALDRLTLGLVHAGAYIRQRRFTFARYLTEWHANRGKVLDWANEAVTGYPMSLAQTWLTSMEQLTASGRALLERLSFFANDPVPEFLLDVAVPGAETAEGLEPLLDLQRFSLVARDTETERFTVHRIVRDVTNRRLATEPASHHSRLAEAISWLDAAFEGDPGDVRTWPRLDRLAPHAETLAWAAESASIADPTRRLMGQLGLLLHAKAQHRRAELFSRRALAIGEASLGPDHPEVARDLNNLAVMLHATNRLAEAEALYRRALAIDEASLGLDHPEVARDLNNLAALLHATSRLAEAEPLHRRALAIDEASFGPDHPSVAIRLNNLAGLLQATNRLAAAEPLYRRAFAITESSLGPDHLTVATCVNNLAELLRATNRLTEAEPLYRRALAITESSLGPDHPDVATSLNNLAELLRATKRIAEAEPLYRRALAIDEASLGPDHPDVARDHNNLALLLWDTNRPADAEPLMRRMVVILLAFQRDTNHAHPHRDGALRNYAILLAELGRDETAIRTAFESAHLEAGLG
jgi:tetratricopeptide (TPR) repeat protein